MQRENGVNMSRESIGIGTGAGILGAAVLVGLAGTVQAQEAETRLGWQPFLGCWARPAHMVEVDRPEGEEADEGVLCFVASGSDVEMLTIADGAITHREPFPADGQPRTVEQDGCTGTETARFSSDQRRIYTTSEVTCADGVSRSSTGITSMAGPSEWLDVRAMEVNGRATVWSQWYQRTTTSALRAVGMETGENATPLAMRGARSHAFAPIMIDDVIEAAGAVHPQAVEAWLAETGQPFAGLDSKDLIRLDDAGVPSGVIDVVVAVSFPERFALNRQDIYDEPTDMRYGRTIWASRAYDPFYYGYGYGPYAYRSYRYGYPWGSWGYGGYGGYGYYGGGYYTPVVIDISKTSGGGGGRVVAGRGYKAPRSVAGGNSRSPGGRAWAGSGTTYRGGSGAVSSGGSGSSGRSAVSRGGSRSSGSSTGRTARRRGGK